MRSSDAIVIGGGPNGLACAARLAASGRQVTLCEAGAVAGGGAVTAEFAPGYRVSSLAHLLGHLDARVIKGMDLERHGLAFAATGLATTAVSAIGDHLRFEGPAGARLTGRVAPADALAWQHLRARLLGFAAALAPMRAMTPPRLARGAGNEVMRLARVGLGLRRLGRAEFREFLRMILINVADVAEDELSDDRLGGLLAFDATLGAWLGPRSPNSLMLYLDRLAGGMAGQQAALALPQGGMGSVATAMARGAEAKGVTVRTGSRVARILVEGGRAVGVTLSDGTEIRAPLIVSAIGPKLTLAGLVGPRHLDTGFLRQVAAIRARGGAAKLHLALTGLPDFRGADPKTRLVIAPSVNAVEAAFNPVKYAEVPDRPVMEIILPSAHEAGFAPAGHHVLSAIVQFAPHAPKDGADAARALMLAQSLAVLEDHAPGLGALIGHAEMLMPYDIAARHGMEGGAWHHADLAVEQMLFLRPFAAVAQYRTPIAGLWLAGAGSHPGGHVSGSAGWNAAGAILAEGGA